MFQYIKYVLKSDGQNQDMVSKRMSTIDFNGTKVMGTSTISYHMFDEKTRQVFDEMPQRKTNKAAKCLTNDKLKDGSIQHFNRQGVPLLSPPRFEDESSIAKSIESCPVTPQLPKITHLRTSTIQPEKVDQGQRIRSPFN